MKGRKEGRKESAEKGRTTSQPFRGDRAGSMERDWGFSKTGSVLRPIYYPPPRARARIKTRAACRLPVPRTPNAAGALSSLRGSLESFYERSLWKQASCARDKPAVPIYTVCIRIHTKAYEIHACAQHTQIYALRAVRYAHQRKAHEHI